MRSKTHTPKGPCTMLTQNKTYKEALKTHLRKGRFVLSAKMIVAAVKVTSYNRKARALQKREKGMEGFLNQVHFEHTIAMEQYESKK